MTPQEVFDKVAKHLLTQKAKSQATDNDTCMYRGENGLKCAVGVLIEDDEYSPRMEMGIGSLLASTQSPGVCPPSVYKRLRPHSMLLKDLQHIHDGDPVEAWEKKLKEKAIVYNLNWTIT